MADKHIFVPMKTLFCVIISYAILALPSVFSQVLPADIDTVFTSIKIYQDPRLNKLVQKHKAIHGGEGVRGYRVQIFFGSGKKEALEVKGGFVESYAGYEGYVIYDMPYFKVRVGDFMTHLEAQKLLREISEDYPGSFIVKDMIPVPGQE